MISKLTAQCNNQNKQFKPKIYQGKKRGQRIIMIKVSTRIDTDLTVMIEECHLGTDLGMDQNIVEDHNMLIITEITSGEEILGKHKNRGQHYRCGCSDNYRNDNFRRGRSRSKERQYSGNFRRDD